MAYIMLLFKFVQNKKSFKKLLFGGVVQYYVEICGLAICGSKQKNCGFPICGLAYLALLAHLRINVDGGPA
jgi:hypothetical protein